MAARTICACEWCGGETRDVLMLCEACERERSAAIEAARTKRTNPPKIVAGRDLLVFDLVGGGVIVVRPDAAFRLVVHPMQNQQGGTLTNRRSVFEEAIDSLSQAAEVLADRAPDAGSL